MWASTTCPSLVTLLLDRGAMVDNVDKVCALRDEICHDAMYYTMVSVNVNVMLCDVVMTTSRTCSSTPSPYKCTILILFCDTPLLIRMAAQR
jgi:hypothetical protein